MSRIFSDERRLGLPALRDEGGEEGAHEGRAGRGDRWLTGFDEVALKRHLDEGTTFEDFFADADLNPNATLITGIVCGVRVQNVDDPLMQKIRYLDKLVDELAKGRPMAKILRG